MRKNGKKNIRNLVVGIVGVAAALLVAGCASGAKATSKGKDPVMLDHAGRALGKTDIPKWVDVYATSRSVTSVEALSDYRQDYCFIAEDTGTNLKALQAWLNTVQINDVIASRISTRVGSTAEANVSTSNNEEYTNFLNNVMTVTRDATYTGVVKNSDYWVLWRNYDVDDETRYNDEYTAYVLYTIRKEQLNEQIANQFRQIQANANTAEERAMWTGLIQAILEDGLGVEVAQPSQSGPIADIDVTIID